jgi:hypothetical protein
MSAVWMFIEKFGGRVKIDEDHPLAVAQRAKDAAAPKIAGGAPVVPPPSGLPSVDPLVPQRDPLEPAPPAEATKRRGRPK